MADTTDFVAFAERQEWTRWIEQEFQDVTAARRAYFVDAAIEFAAYDANVRAALTDRSNGKDA